MTLDEAYSLVEQSLQKFGATVDSLLRHEGALTILKNLDTLSLVFPVFV